MTKQVMDRPAGFEDNGNICRVCRARVPTTGLVCKCGSTQLANSGGYYRVGNEVRKL